MLSEIGCMSKAGLSTSMMPVPDVLVGILHVERGVRARAISSHLDEATAIAERSSTATNLLYLSALPSRSTVAAAATVNMVSTIKNYDMHSPRP
jgi:hypothetical protein